MKDNSELSKHINQMIETRIKPAMTPGEGEIVFRGFNDGVVYVEFAGSGSSFKTRMEKMLIHQFPEVLGIADYAEHKPSLGLDTETGRAVQRVVDERINPTLAAHGGRISLVDVLEDTVYVRMEGGCQGCQMSAATLKQNITKDIQEYISEIRMVLDVTDHDGGNNPFYRPPEPKKGLFSRLLRRG